MKQAWWRRLCEFYNDPSPSLQVDNSESDRVGGADSYTGDADIDTWKSSGEVAIEENKPSMTELQLEKMVLTLSSQVVTLQKQVAYLMKHNDAAAKVCLIL